MIQISIPVKCLSHNMTKYAILKNHNKLILYEKRVCEYCSHYY
jgi:hypothetical protein